MEVERWWEIHDAKGEEQHNGGVGGWKSSLGKFRPNLFRYFYNFSNCSYKQIVYENCKQIQIVYMRQTYKHQSINWHAKLSFLPR